MILFFFYTMGVFGAVLVAWPWIFRSIQGSTVRKTVRQIRVSRENRLQHHVRSIMTTLYFDTETTSQSIDRKITTFFGQTGGIFFLTYYLFLRQNAGMMSVVWALLLAGLPYCYLRLKLASMQITGSYEGQVVITEILNQYKINYQNPIEAIEKSIRHLDRVPIGKRLLFCLVLRLHTYRSDEELRMILEDFALGINTEWGRMLSTNLYYAISEDANVTAGLEDLLKECELGKKMLEQGKRMNREAFSVITLLVPAIYLALIWALVQYMGFTIPKVIHYQFFTQNGLILFAVLLVLLFVTTAVSTVMRRPKFDV